MAKLDEAMKLGASRWAVPLLAELHSRRGARGAELTGRLGITRSSLGRGLDHLADCGWVMRNPGHGHPLRPEYILTEMGQPVAERAVRLNETYDRLGLAPAGLLRWSLPIVVALKPEAHRFSELRGELAPATARALSLTLKRMMATHLILRRVIADFPPTPIYALTQRGGALAEAF